MYFTNVGDKGPVRDGKYPFAIKVLSSRYSDKSIGVAHPVGRTDRGFALWKLVVFGVEVAGRWVIVDRRFIKVR